MEFLRHILRLCVVILFSVFGTNTALAVPMSASDITYFQTEIAHFAQADDGGFSARAPPVAVGNVAITGGVTAMYRSAFALREQETVAALYGFGGDSNAPNTGVNLPATQWDNWTPPSGYVRNADGTVTHATSGQVYMPLRSSNGQVRVDGDGNPIFNTQSGGTTAQTTLTNPSTSGPTITPPVPISVPNPPSLTISNAQWGTKSNQHMRDFDLDVTNPAHRQQFRDMVENIGSNPDRVVSGTMSGGGPGGRRDVLFYVKGNDVVATSPSGEFVTVLQNGVTNPNVITALGQ